jgi:transposase-like protein
MKLNTQDGTTFDWPDDWPQPTKGANASPLLNAEAFEATKRDIEKNGLYDKIHFTPEGKISKGRSRYRMLRELGWTHERIVEKASVIVETTDEQDALSNILRAHRTKTAHVASYFIVNFEEPKTLIDERKKKGGGPKRSGLLSKVAKTVGCDPAVVTRLIDWFVDCPQKDYIDCLKLFTTDHGRSMDYPALRLVNDEIVQTGEVETLDKVETQTQERSDEKSDRSELSESIKNDEKRDRRKLSEETERAIVKSLDSGASISETARKHEVSKSVVHKLKKQQEAQPATTTTHETTKGTTTKKSDPVEAKLAAMWKKYRDKKVTPDLFRQFVSDAVEVPGSVSIVKAALEEFPAKSECEAVANDDGDDSSALQKQQFFGRKPSSAAEKRIKQLEAKVRELESLVLPLDDTQKDALRQYKRQVDKDYKLRWKLSEAVMAKRAITMHSKDYALFFAGFHPDASKEKRDQARNRFVYLYKKRVLTDEDKVKWPPQSEKP